MTDDKRNTVSVKIYQESLDFLDAEKKRLKALSPMRPKPSNADVIELALSAYQAKSPQKSSTQNTETRDTIEPHAEWLQVLRRILDSGHAVAMNAITQNLRAFEVLIHSDVRGKVKGARPLSQAEIDAILQRIRDNQRGKPGVHQRPDRKDKAG